MNSESPYSEYGSGTQLLFAFHGYGMNGDQFLTFTKSLIPTYKIIGFHLPYHRNGPENHQDWIAITLTTIYQIITDRKVQNYSLAGYSIGARICLHLLPHLPSKIETLFLFAPYGLEKHIGLKFVSTGFGHHFFKAVLNSRIPEFLMNFTRFLGFIDSEHEAIILRELDTAEKRKNLCYSLLMSGELPVNSFESIKRLNELNTKTTIVYGRNDVLFPFKNRNQKLLNLIKHRQVIEVKESHWLMTERLDLLLATNQND